MNKVGPSILRTAHGNAAKHGAIIVAECPPLDEHRPLDPARTALGLALRAQRGRPFTPGNAAASGRGPSLTRITTAPDAPEEIRRIHRKAACLAGKRRRELDVQCGGPVSSAVRVELVAWARATAWAEHFDRQGDAMKAATLAEKASGHGLKALAIAEREATAHPQSAEQQHAARLREIATS